MSWLSGLRSVFWVAVITGLWGVCRGGSTIDVAQGTQCSVTAAMMWWLAALVTMLRVLGAMWLQGMSGRDAPVSSGPSLVLASDVTFVAKVAIKFSKKFA